MNTSEIINLILAIGTIVLASISIIILIISIKQNNKMLEHSTRPNINIYGTTTYFYKIKEYYFVIRNFGNSSGKIISISSDEDLSQFAIEGFPSPFSFIKNLTLSPNQSYIVTLNEKVLKEYEKETIAITLIYEGLGKLYKEETTINIRYLQKNVVTKWNANSVDVISGTLQDMAKRRL